MNAPAAVVGAREGIWSWAGLLGLTVGALNSLQARMNGELSGALGEPVYAALWPFGTGWILLTAILLARPPVRAGVPRVRAQVRAGRLPRWHTVGGVVGGLFVLTQAYAVPLAGVALYTVAFVSGQLAGGILVDKAGLGPAGRAPVTGRRVLAAALALAGVTLAVTGRRLDAQPSAAAATDSVVSTDSVVATGSVVSTDSVVSSVAALPTPGLPVLAVVLSVLVGAAVAAQQAVNGRVNAVSHHPVATSWLNFVWGCATLLAAAALGWAQGRPVDPRWPSAPLWAWFGGIIGVLFIVTGAVIVRRLGVLATMLVLIVGQLAGAVVLDLLNPATRHTVGVVVVLGVLLTAGAGALATSGPPGATRRGRTLG